MTTTTSDSIPPAPVEVRRSAGVRFVVAFGFGLAFVAAVVVGGIYAFERQYEGRILPGVRVGQLDLSGLTPGQAKAELSQAYSALGKGRIVVVGPDGEASITYAEVGRGPDVDAIVDEALAAGRSGSPVERVIAEARTALRGVQVPPRVRFDPAAVADRLAALTRPLDRDPVDATVVVTPAGFATTQAREGRRLDETAARETILADLPRLDAPSEIRVALALEAIPPDLGDADAALARSRAERMARDVVLSVGDETWAIEAATVRGWLGFAVTPDGRYEPTVERAGILAAVGPLADKIDRAPKDASFLIGKNDQIIGVRPGVDGRALDTEATADRVATALALRMSQTTEPPAVEPALIVTKPELTTEEAATVAPTMSRISTWTTYYPIGEKNGFGANIEIPARYIDGTVVPPGGVFDFWEVVGTVSRAKGYRQGGAIINGRTEPQGALAGGICSASTTIFNAAVRAGLEMGARRNHYYYIDRYPLGLDATVFISASGSKQTMSFTNDTPNPLLIRGYITRKGTKGYVRFDIWSVPTGRTVTFSTPIVKNRKPATTVTQETSTLAAGKRQRIEYAVEGKDVWVTRTVRDANGSVIHQETYYSHYARITGIVLVGTGSAGSATDPSPTPEPSDSPAPSTDPSPDPSPAP